MNNKNLNEPKKNENFSEKREGQTQQSGENVQQMNNKPREDSENISREPGIESGQQTQEKRSDQDRSDERKAV